MSAEKLRLVLRSLRHAAGLTGAPADGELLARWVERRDEAAFEVLVWRHGPLVLGACERVLRCAAEVEDAFQATFLTLVRRAGAIRRGDALAAWLHRVAHRAALRLRRNAVTRARREGPWVEGVDRPASAADIETAQQLDAEIDRLPRRYREAVVLCLLQGHTQPEAAAVLGVPAGTLSCWLSRGRARLRRHLARPDCAAPAPALPAALVGPAVSTALRWAGLDGAGEVPARLVELSTGVITDMARRPLLAPLAILTLATLAGAVLALGPWPRQGPAAARAQAKADPEPPLLFTFQAIEPFNGKLRLNWRPVRADAKYASLTKNKGKLTLTTQQGSIHADEVKRKDPKAKNIYLIDNPLADDQDFEVTVCLSGFTPKQSYQQAAVICYDDDDNYIKWCYEFDWEKGNGTCLRLVRETKAVTQHDKAEPPEGKKLWLRLTRRGSEYEYTSSGDGKRFTAHGEKAWGTKGPAKLGFLAKNGGQPNVPEVDVCFELFQLRSPPPAKKKD